MENVFLIAGLGNPGREYRGTRHNAGFMVADRLGERWRSDWKTERRFEARVAQVRLGGSTVWLCQPLTFMNLSGRAVVAVLNYHRIPAGSLLVTVDDADLPLGSLRLRGEGSSGGHHGLESMEASLGTRGFARQRIGIGRRPEGRREITDHVLGRFSDDEAAVLDQVLVRAADQVECWLNDGLKRAMDRYNGRLPELNSESET